DRVLQPGQPRREVLGPLRLLAQLRPQPGRRARLAQRQRLDLLALLQVVPAAALPPPVEVVAHAASLAAVPCRRPGRCAPPPTVSTHSCPRQVSTHSSPGRSSSGSQP